MTNLILLDLLAACAATLFGLLALWAGLGRGHWFIRTAVVAAAIVVFLAVPAFDLTIVFLTQTLTIAAPLWLWRSVRPMRGRKTPDETNHGERSEHELPRAALRYSCKDLFLVALVVAGITSLAVYLPAEHSSFWPSYVAIGAGLGVVCLAATWAALGRRWTWLRWGVLLGVAGSVGFAMRLAKAPDEVNENLFTTDIVFSAPESPPWFAIVAIGVAALLLVAWLWLFRSAGWLQKYLPGVSCSEPRDAPVQGQGKCRAARLISLCLLAPSILLPLKAYAEMLFPPAAPSEPIPAPNGYEVLAVLGGELEQTSLFESEHPAEEDLRSFIDTNRARLEAAHAALNLPHLVSVDYETDRLALDVKRFGNLRQLSRAMVVEGDSALLEGRPDDAARCYLDTIRLARVIAHGGLLINMLVGNAVDGHGLSRLCAARASLSTPATRSALEELQRLDDERDPVAEVLERENIWQRRVGGWAERLSFRAQGDYLQPAIESPKAAISKTHLLIGALAVQLYQLEHGQPPERLEDLVPQFLSRTPDDPYSGRPLKYSASGTSYRLYSIGPDLDDDGGRPIPGDILYGDGDFVIEQHEPAGA